jgi:hypothetical protein
MRKGIFMHTESSRYQVVLEHRGLFDIADAAGVTLRCDSGNLWITLDNDPRDIVLSAGEVLTTDEHRRALVYALGASTLTLEAKAKPPQARRTAEATLLRFGFKTAAA